MLDHKTLRLPATLLLGGLVSYVLVTLLHTGGPANDHQVIFDDYAGSHDWAAVHVGQFAAMAVLVAGLITLCSALHPEIRTSGWGWVTRLGAILAGVALGLYGVLQAVDGVALKQAVDAWVDAPAAEKAARFANAETVRWLEWGSRSYHTFALGLALILVGLAIAWTARLPRALGLLVILSGAAYLAQGWVLGSDGFTDTDSTAISAGYLAALAWIVWLTFIAWRPAPSESRAAARSREGAAPVSN